MGGVATHTLKSVTEHKNVFSFSPHLSVTFVIPKQFSHTPLMLHTSHANVYIRKYYLQLTAPLVLSLLHISAVNSSHFPTATSAANTLTFRSIHGAHCVISVSDLHCTKLWGETLLPEVLVLHCTYFIVSCVLQF